MQWSNRSITKLAWVLLAAWTLAPSPSLGQTGTVTSSEEDARNAATRERLQKSVRIEFIETPVTDVMLFLSDAADFQFYIDEKALGDAAIPSESPITVNLTTASVETALDLALQQVDLTYYLRSGLVIVTANDALESVRETRVYPAADLLNEVRNPRESLVELITATIEPEQWDMNGGLGAIRSFRGTLVITQNPNVHRKIEKLLAQLRKATESTAAAQPAEDPQREVIIPTQP